jgi:hypothetical protein
MGESRKLLSVEIEEAIKADWRHSPWYRQGEALFNPSMADMRGPDGLERHLLSGWRPPAPVIGPQTRLTLIGGCFCDALAGHLRGLDAAAPIDAAFLPINETLGTSFALRQLFEWEFEGVKPDPALLKGNRALDINFHDALWKPTLARLQETDVFFLLVSSAEIWCDAPTGAVLWREVPGANADRQQLRTSTVAENLDNLREIHRLIRKHRPQAKVIYALSPIPMIATYRREGAIAANTVSKAVMRAAMDELYREARDDGHTFYFPYYEAVLEGFGATPYGGHFNGDRRHVNDLALDFVTHQFQSFYCTTAAPDAALFDALLRAKVSTQDLPASIVQAADAGDRRALQHLINEYVRTDDQPMAQTVARYAAQSLPEPAAEPETDWTPCDLAWQLLPSLAWAGPAPQVFRLPDVAWAYGAASAAVTAEAGKHLLIRVRMRVLAGVAGVMLIRPDGSALSDRDIPVRPEDGWVEAELRVYPADGPAHVLLRNYDCDGVAGQVEVESVHERRTVCAAPTI